MVNCLCLIASLIIASSALGSTASIKKANRATWHCQDCNVILIALDALQAAHVHHLGYARSTTPMLDKLAAEGYSFKQAISPASWTVPTYLSVFSSTFPSVHGLTNRYERFSKTEQKVANFSASMPKLITLAETLRKAGYRTGGFTGDSGVGSVLGYNKGFEVYTDEVPFGGLNNSASHATQWLDQMKGEKFFLFLHGYDAHGQFKLASDYVSRFAEAGKSVRFKGTPTEQGELRELGLAGKAAVLTNDEVEFWRAWYDGKIADADERLAKFLQELDERGLRNKSIIVIFSDHGTEFYEHGRFDHGHSLYDELIHVPLVFWLPHVKGSNLIDGQVGAIDIMPTILDILEVKPSAQLKKQMVGRSLVPALMRGQAEARDMFSETDYRNYSHKRSVRSADGWKYIMTLETGSDELYNLTEDPAEKNNVVTAQKAKAAQLHARLMKYLKTKAPLRPAAKETRCLPAYPGQCN